MTTGKPQPSRRHARHILLPIAVTVAIAATITVAVVFAQPVSWFSPIAATGQLDTNVNSQTGLADGTYELDVATQLTSSGACTFTGWATTPTGQRRGPVTVASNDTATCGQRRPLTPAINLIRFTVTDGIATINETIATR